MFVLVADDNLLSCTRLLGQLHAAGWDARAACAGPEAMTLARQKRPDVIVVNLAATSHDAALFIGALKAEPDLAAIPVLGFCGHRDVTRREAAAAAGCDRVVANSAIAAGLPALVRALAGGPSQVGPRD
jgi:CheY-like chemotaxis protein